MKDYPMAEEKCPFCGYSREQQLQDAEEFPDVLPPETILNGRFILGRTLSISDFSVIYRSWDALLQREVAVREYLPFSLGQRDRQSKNVVFRSDQERGLFVRGLTAFETEGQQLNENHDVEGIVNVYKVLEEHNTAYLVMEYVKGETLQDMIDEGRMISEKDQRRLLAAIGRVVDAFHSRGICHFNLTPENILVDDYGQIMILDFSGAKREIYRILNRNANILDMRYASPETLSGEGADGRADMYSLGAIGYRLYTGKEPPQSRPRRRARTGLKIGDPAIDRVIETLTMPNPGYRPVKTDGLFNA